MRTLVATVMGFCSGFLIYMMTMMLVMGPSIKIPVLIIITLLSLVGGWVISVYLLRRKAQTVSRVFARGFLLGAAEWFAMIFVGLIFSTRTVGETLSTDTPSTAASAGAALGGGLIAFVTGGVSIAMALTCLIGFAIAHFMGREMRAESAPPTRKCPECAELIQEQANRCRYCGAQVGAAKTV